MQDRAQVTDEHSHHVAELECMLADTRKQLESTRMENEVSQRGLRAEVAELNERIQSVANAQIDKAD